VPMAPLVQEIHEMQSMQEGAECPSSS
jgi:hypothetical protein